MNDIGPGKLLGGLGNLGLGFRVQKRRCAKKDPAVTLLFVIGPKLDFPTVSDFTKRKSYGV